MTKSKEPKVKPTEARRRAVRNWQERCKQLGRCTICGSDLGEEKGQLTPFGKVRLTHKACIKKRNEKYQYSGKISRYLEVIKKQKKIIELQRKVIEQYKLKELNKGVKQM
jgi:hypothetical protein